MNFVEGKESSNVLEIQEMSKFESHLWLVAEAHLLDT